MMSYSIAQSDNKDGSYFQTEILGQHPREMPEASLFERVGLEDISGPEISQMFEGFTPILTLDTEKHTYCIGYGTDIGKKISHFPYGDNADDIAAYMQSIGFSDTKIQSLLQGNEPIDEDLAQRFFSLRYLKKRSTLILSYEKLCDKKFTNLPSIIQKALVDFSYNMCGETGIFPSPGFSGFPEACKALKNEDWALFAHEIAESTYATQVGPRRAGYWVYQLTQLSDKPLTAMTGDVRAEVRSFKKVKPEMEERIRIILAESHRRERG